MSQEPTPRRARHLMDPTAPRKRSTPEDLARLEHVQRTVMSVLVGQKLLRQNQAELYQEVPLPTEVKERSVVTSAADLSYFERKVRDELLRSSWLASTPELRKYLVFNGGLKVTTTYDPRAQELAEAAARTNPLKAANPDTQAVVASVEPATGAVRAVVGVDATFPVILERSVSCSPTSSLSMSWVLGSSK